ncbi:cytoplasmic phosphatidylinositol transfer protein 1-like isoform X1 [Tyto alba]|uniref:cytoplasmic phosphatidylinositol transfer protein 1-like isoform X1 n=1 Tax=Tyto alba TaxID=56313 RepID=UPI001C66F0A2|nr:cytoplasmic phosphatidylinositol transfer protein 1-like isoform X1 [Tyto alba]
MGAWEADERRPPHSHRALLSPPPPLLPGSPQNELCPRQRRRLRLTPPPRQPCPRHHAHQGVPHLHAAHHRGVPCGAALHHQQAQSPGEREGRGCGGGEERAPRGPRPRPRPVHREARPPLQAPISRHRWVPQPRRGARKLPSWARAVTPRIFYITEKAWNYYPYTITEYTCSFLPKFSIYIETKYEDNCGDSENIFHSDKILGDHEISFLDIAFDEIPERYYRSLEDPRFFSSAKTGRGPLREGWRQHTKPIMCSYKLVSVKFEVWGLQTRVEQFVHKVIRDILLIGHRQAFAWVDEWCDMSLEDVRAFETQMQVATNQKLGSQHP